MRILLLFLVIFASCEKKEVLIYFKDPRTNQCFAAQTKEGLAFKFPTHWMPLPEPPKN